MRYAIVLVVLLDFALTWNVTAQARAQTELPYTLGEAFSTALRFVRIDRGCKIVDKDGDAAFVTFECADGAAVHRGSLELFKAGNGVRAQVTLNDDTYGTELRWLELYERKLRDELGTPVPAPAPPAAQPKPAHDGGA